MKKHQILKVNGMSCGHCTAAVKNAVESFKGTENVSVKLEGGLVEFDFDPALFQLDDAVAAIEDEGFEVEI